MAGSIAHTLLCFLLRSIFKKSLLSFRDVFKVFRQLAVPGMHLQACMCFSACPLVSSGESL